MSDTKKQDKKKEPKHDQPKPPTEVRPVAPLEKKGPPKENQPMSDDE